MNSPLAVTEASKAGLTRGERHFFAYLQVRLRMRDARHLRLADYHALLRMDAGQIANALSEGNYAAEARALAVGLAGVELVTAMVRQRLLAEGRVVRRLCRLSPAAAGLLRMYCWKYDLRYLRAAIRARHAHGDMTGGMLASLSNISLGTYDALCRTDRLDTSSPVLREFHDTPFAGTLHRMASDRPPTLDEIEVALVHDYHTYCLGEWIASLDRADPLRPLLEGETHLLNLRSVLSFRLAHASAEQALVHIVPCGFWASEETVRALLSHEDLRAMVAHLGRAQPGGTLAMLDLPRQGEITAGELDVAAQRAAARLARQTLHNPTAGAAALVAYLALLETEAHNLWAIVSGVRDGLSPDDIRKVLVL
jgi:vacuolar-type H+-ATPase subunit C/Vma6